ncbi:MAG: AGE family epimerase/isomerase [Candidatus Marinimicrobia bacterium]|nr:AGE family epimerase/isomerase [Candidatus Neomarinimicrobiota bacterium]
MNNSLKLWKKQAESELKENILNYWIKYTLDRENGGFYGEITNDNKINKNASKSLIQNTRILWTFSAAYKCWREPKYLEIANRAYNYLVGNFIDQQYGGAYWLLDASGESIDVKKKSYGQAFFIYALSEYYMATKLLEVKKRAIEYFNLIEEHFYDLENGGYFETCNRDWSLATDLRLSDKDMNEKKSMNNHLHLLEAYTNLYRIWDNSELRARLRELLEIFIDNIICSSTFHFKLFFNEYWKSKSDKISFGHDIEGSWLLWEAAKVLDDSTLESKIESIILKMAGATVEEGITDKKALIYEKEGNGQPVDEIDWWPQAEAVVGLLNAYQISKQEKYLNLARHAWNFIDKYIIDKQYGEWYYKVTPAGKPYQDLAKISEWKGPYHNGRACMELSHRLEAIIKN